MILDKQKFVEEMNKFISDADTKKDDWYVSEQSMASRILTQFAEHLGITLDELESLSKPKT